VVGGALGVALSGHTIVPIARVAARP